MKKFLLILACLGTLILLSHAANHGVHHGKPLPTAVVVIAMTVAIAVAEAITVVEAIKAMETITVAETLTAATAIAMAAAILVTAAVKIGKPVEVAATRAKDPIYFLVNSVTPMTEVSSR